MKAEIIIQEAARRAGDPNMGTYAQDEWVELVNDAELAVCLVRPDALSVTEAVQITVNQSKQDLPASRRRLLGLVRNEGADGLTAGRAIIGPSTMEEQDAVLPNWHTETGTEVLSYIYDELVPTTFYVYPHLTSAWYVLAEMAKNPTRIDEIGDNINLDDIYSVALREWMLFGAFARSNERTPDWTRASRHLQTFFAVLQVKTKADFAASPKNLEYDKQLDTLQTIARTT